MNAFEFMLLMKDIYGPGMPDIKKIQRRGLLAVKIAQHFALRIDFLNPEKCAHLAQLYRAAIPVPAEESMKLLDSYTPAGWRDNFTSIDREPLAAASVGQVHAARLKSGEKVVVKIIKGDFKKKFIRDAAAVKSLFNAVIFFYPKLAKVFDPVAAIRAIEEYTVNELDLRNEYKGQQVFAALKEEGMKKTDMSLLKFAKIHTELSGENVMVSEFVEAKTFDELLERGELTYSNILDLFHLHGYYMFGAGTFHGDIHPGNIFLKGKQIYFIDTAAVAAVTPRTKAGLLKFFAALSVYDYAQSAECINNMAIKGISGAQLLKFREAFQVLYKDFKDSSVGEVSLTKKMMQTIRLGVLSGMEFDHDMFPIIKSLMYLDGMVLRCKPDAVLVRDMGPFIKEAQGW